MWGSEGLRKPLTDNYLNLLRFWSGWRLSGQNRRYHHLPLIKVNQMSPPSIWIGRCPSRRPSGEFRRAEILNTQVGPAIYLTIVHSHPLRMLHSPRWHTPPFLCLILPCVPSTEIRRAGQPRGSQSGRIISVVKILCQIQGGATDL